MNTHSVPATIVMAATTSWAKREVIDHSVRCFARWSSHHIPVHWLHSKAEGGRGGRVTVKAGKGGGRWGGRGGGGGGREMGREGEGGRGK